MSAQLNDELIAERSGILGKLTVKDILNAVYLSSPTNNDKSAEYFYFGWRDTGLIQRQKRSDASTQSFTSRDFAADWSNRENLGYV